MKNYITYPKYKDSNFYWLTKIPSHWELKKVKHLFKFNKDRNKAKEPIVLSLTMKGIIVRNINNNEGQLAASYDNYIHVKKEDIVFNPMDLISGWVDMVPMEGVISPAYQTIRPKNELIALRYAKYYFQRLYKEKVLYYFGKGISFDYRWTLGDEALMNFPLLLPTKQEQIYIANFLDKKIAEIKHFIELKEKTIELLKERKVAIINHAVTKGIDPNVEMIDSGFEWLGEIPKHWKVVPLRYLGRNQNGISKDSDYFGSGLPFVSYGDVYKNRSLPLNVEGLAKSSKADRRTYSILKGDVLFTRTSESIEEIGFASTCLHTIDDATFSGFLIRFRPKKQSLDENFSKYFFRSSVHRIFFVKEMNMVIRASLSQGLLNKMPVNIPSMSEQIEIANFLDLETKEYNNSISNIKNEISLIKEYQQSLISEAVTGKIDVRDE